MSFDNFWCVYPIKRDKKAARKAYDKALLLTTHDEIIQAITKYKAWLNERDAKTWRPEPKYPASWLNGECWTDEYDAPTQSSCSPEESRHRARVAAYNATGRWLDEWGNKPTENVIQFERTA